MVAAILGRFIPPHKGHAYLIARALDDCDVLYLFLCTLSRDALPGVLRTRWLRSMYRREIAAGRLRLVVVNEEDERAERHEPDAPKLWARAMQRYTSNTIDRIYSSEDYGQKLADALGAACVSVDPDRAQVPVNATRIREHPLTEWRFIPSAVRPYFAHHYWSRIARDARPSYCIIVAVPEKATREALAERFTTLHADRASAAAMQDAEVFFFCRERPRADEIEDPENILSLPDSTLTTTQIASYLLSLVHA